eukprot:8250193-Pyramimonas_sp.AAC.2
MRRGGGRGCLDDGKVTEAADEGWQCYLEAPEEQRVALACFYSHPALGAAGPLAGGVGPVGLVRGGREHRLPALLHSRPGAGRTFGHIGAHWSHLVTWRGTRSRRDAPHGHTVQNNWSHWCTFGHMAQNTVASKLADFSKGSTG